MSATNAKALTIKMTALAPTNAVHFKRNYKLSK